MAIPAPNPGLTAGGNPVVAAESTFPFVGDPARSTCERTAIEYTVDLRGAATPCDSAHPCG
jgi:hypothetical protein